MARVFQLRHEPNENFQRKRGTARKKLLSTRAMLVEGTDRGRYVLLVADLRLNPGKPDFYESICWRMWMKD